MTEKFQIFFPTQQRSELRSGLLQLSDTSLGNISKAYIAPGENIERYTAITKELMRNSMTAGIIKAPAKIKAIFFDMDATVIHQESIVELSKAAGKQDEVEKITEEAMAGKIDFEEALRQRVAMLEGLPSSIIEETAKNLTVFDGLKIVAQKAVNAGIELYLISGGFLPLAEKIAQPMGFAGWQANQLEVKANYLTGKVHGQIIDGLAKQTYVKNIMKKNDWHKEEVVVVGDGANDMHMMSEAGISIGFNPKSILIEQINLGNFSGNHCLLEDILFN